MIDAASLVTVYDILPFESLDSKKDHEVSFPEIPWKSCLSNLPQTHFTHNPLNAAFEYFVKKAIQTPMRVGETVTLSSLDGTKVSYTVHQKIGTLGLIAYGLKPLKTSTETAPLIVFRSTVLDFQAEDAIAAMVNNFEPNIGERSWLATKEQFNALMSDTAFRKPDEKVEVAGYSLGAAYVQHFVAQHHQNVSKATLFSSSGISASTVDTFAKDSYAEQRDTPLEIRSFRGNGDPLVFFGEKLLGQGANPTNVKIEFLEIEYPERGKFLDLTPHWRVIFPITPDACHTVTEDTSKESLDIKLNNYAYSNFSWLIANAHQILGSIIVRIRACVEAILSLTQPSQAQEPLLTL